MSGGGLFTHLYQREKFKESEVRIYTAEIILALQHLHKVRDATRYFDEIETCNGMEIEANHARVGMIESTVSAACCRVLAQPPSRRFNLLSNHCNRSLRWNHHYHYSSM